MKTSLYSLTSAPASRRLLIGLFGSIGCMLGVSSASAVIFQDNFGSGGISLTNPQGRATGWLADKVKYDITNNNDNEVAITGGLLDWTGTSGSNGNLTADNGGQSWRFSTVADTYTYDNVTLGTTSTAFDWAPYLRDKYQISFTYRTAWSHPLTFGLSDVQVNGSWNADASGAFDYAFGAYGFNWQSGSDGVSQNSGGGTVSLNTEYEILLKFDETAGTAVAYVDGSEMVSRSIDFENAGRYFTFGEPTQYGGYIDNFTVIPEPSMFGLVALAGLSIGFFRRRR